MPLKRCIQTLTSSRRLKKKEEKAPRESCVDQKTSMDSALLLLLMSMLYLFSLWLPCCISCSAAAVHAIPPVKNESRDSMEKCKNLNSFASCCNIPKMRFQITNKTYFLVTGSLIGLFCFFYRCYIIVYSYGTDSSLESPYKLLTKVLWNIFLLFNWDVNF